MSYERESFKVAATLAAYRIVSAVTGTANTVQYSPTIASAYARPIGVTADTVEDTTSAIPVITHGIAKVYFNDTVTSGMGVTADTSGRGVPFAAVTATSTFCIGTLIGPSVAATATIADVLINPTYEILN